MTIQEGDNGMGVTLQRARESAQRRLRMRRCLSYSGWRTTGYVAQLIGLTPGGATQVLMGMLRRGLVERRQEPRHGLARARPPAFWRLRRDDAEIVPVGDGRRG